MAEVINIEELKKEKDGLDIISDLYRYAETGFDSIDPRHFPLFRWYGLYQQKPNVGHFMQRIKVPGGQVNSAQLKALAKISQDFGRNLIDITTRQDFQYHWLTIENVPEIYRRLKEVGMTTSGACGDITRNVISCPICGINKDEYFDATPYVKQVSDFMTDNKDFSNMPRKYKFSLSACHIQCAQPDINCVGLVGTKKGDTFGFGLKIGGGLSTKPYFSQDLGVIVHFDQLIPVVKAVSEIFRDAEVLRKSRGQARLKFLMNDPKIGLGPVEFRRQIEEKLGYKLEDCEPAYAPRVAETDHLGISEQKQPGLYYVGVGLRCGRLTGDKLAEIAEIVEEFSETKLMRCTGKQNFIISDIREERLDELKARLDQAELDYRPSVFKRALVSCTGTEFCNLAVTETKEVGRRVSAELEERFPEAAKNIRIHFSGCPNSCGQAVIADIGLRGMKTKGPDGIMIEAFDIMVGGATGVDRAFAETVVKKYPSNDIATAIGNLYEAFLTADPTLTFQEFVRGYTKEQLDAIARGLPMPEVVPAES